MELGSKALGFVPISRRRAAPRRDMIPITLDTRLRLMLGLL